MSLYYKIKRKLFPVENGTVGFVPQFRLEGRSRDANNESGLEMRIADPLWMLGRQWQFGEFKGEDNGSPITVKANYRKEQASFYSFPSSGNQQKIGNVPLEARVEAMEIRPWDLRSKVRIGQKLEELVKAHFPANESTAFIDRLRNEFPLTMEGKPDKKSISFFNLMAGNVPDGGSLWKSIQKNEFPKGEFLLLAPVTDKLKKWYHALFLPAEQESSWQSRNLVHQFSVHGENNIELQAPDYQSGHLDWYSFDKAVIGINPTENTKDSEVFMPVRVSYAAMPDKRLFSFEDSKLELSGMEVDQSDLIKLMIIDFSLVSDNDWFTIPIEMELGELCWVNHITVKDVFGITTLIHNDKDTGQYLDTNPLKTWDAFKIRPLDLLRERGKNNQELYKKEEQFLYLPPVVAFRQESRPLEELLFVRDEYANMVWGIERTVCNELGKPTNGYDLHLELNGPFLKSEADIEENKNSIPQFRLASPVPTNWIPYLPFHIDDTNIELRRAVMMRNETNTAPEDIEPLSILAQNELLTIREEAIPRAGVRVQLTKQRVRWTDGQSYVWLGRKVLAGKGEGSSGLTFDQLLF
ncbi:MAG TPA: hypothetical protein VFG46_18330 [Chryseolinea sp.]|nr:hypothetical protein [Chryseolinea sp.]